MTLRKKLKRDWARVQRHWGAPQTPKGRFLAFCIVASALYHIPRKTVANLTMP